MKNALILLFGCLAGLAVIAAVVASFVLLMNDGDTGEKTIDRAFPETKRERPGSVEPEPGPVETGKERFSEPEETAPVTREKIEGRQVRGWGTAQLVLTVKDVPSLETVPAGQAALVVHQNDVPASPPYETVNDSNCFLFEALVPGRYTFEASTPSGKQGRLSLSIKPGLSYGRDLFVGLPGRLEVKVLSGAFTTAAPLAAASVTAPQIKLGGMTDKKGIFRSRRLFVPDPDIAVTVSHSGYFSTIFHPFARFAPGRDRGRYARIVKLWPCHGDLHFSGTLVDERSGALPGWLLRLQPLGLGGANSTGATFMEDTTNGKGGFLFSRLSPGRYLLEGVNRGWTVRGAADIPSLFSEEILITKGKSIDGRKIVCSLPELTLRGVVLHADTLEPAPGIRVACNGYHGAGRLDHNGDPLHFEDVLTDSNGLFTIDRHFTPVEINRLLERTGLRLIRPDETHEVYRKKSSPADIDAMLDDILDEHGCIKIWLRPVNDLKFRGVVLDFTGAPVKGAVVTAHSLAGSSSQRFRTLTDRSGAFQIRKMHRGTWGVNVTLPNGPNISQRVQVAESSPPLEVKAPGSCRLEGKVNLDDAPNFAKISIRGSSFLIENAHLRRTGNFTFQYLPEEEVTITVTSYAGRRQDEKDLRILTKKTQLKRNNTVHVEL